MHKISVVIPVYNAESTLKRCVSALLSQSFSDFEIVLVNDGSSDNSGSVCRTLVSQDSRIRYIQKENGGASTVRNMGIDISESRYICFADSDDYCDSDMLEFMYNEAERTAADIVMCGYLIESGSSVVENKSCDCLLDGNSINEHIVELKSKNLIDAPWNKLYRRDFLIRTGVRMPVGETYEDTAFNLELLKYKPIISVSSRCFYHYIQNMGSVTKKYSPEKLEIMKKRARLLKSVTAGVDGYCDFYYIKSVFSSFIDMFLSLRKSEIKAVIKREIAMPEFKAAALNAACDGGKSRFIITTAASGNANRIYFFCRAMYILKYKMQRIFMRVK